MTERKLATVRRIKDLLPIKGADRIELALVDGWQVVVGKNLYQVGDLAIYFEIDSFLPGKDPRFASFEERFSTFNGERGLRVKTIRLKKELSQGVLVPVIDFAKDAGQIEEGMDLTEKLNIQKWESVSESTNNNGSNGGSGIRTFPSFIPKTDQERIQNCGRAVEAAIAAGESFERTLKLDGSSLTAYLVLPESKHYKEAQSLKKEKDSNGNWFKSLIKSILNLTDKKQIITAVCSRNIQLKDHNGSNFWNVVEENKLFESMYQFGFSVAVQGEMIGPDIQKNHEKVTKHEFYVFDIYNIDEGRYLTPAERKRLIHLSGLPHAPVLEYDTELSFEGSDVVNGLLNKAKGEGMNKGVVKEGDVYKSMSRDFSFKAINNDYLLKAE